MPDGGLEGKIVNASDGSLAVSDGSDNSPDALEAAEDDKATSLDDVFGEVVGETPSPDGDLAVKVDKGAVPQVDDEGEEETTIVPKTPAVKPTTAKPTETIEGESEADKQARLARDYSGYKPEDAELLKKLPNGVYAHVTKQMKLRYALEKELGLVRGEMVEFKKNPNRVPDNWYEHERAVELTPEYQELAGQYDHAEQHAKHWHTALIAIKNKQNFWGLNWNPVTKQYETTGPHAPSPENEVAVTQQLHQSQSSLAALNAKADELAKNFKQQHSTITSYYESPETTAMFNRLRPELKPVDDEVKLFTDVVHSSHRGHPLAKLGGQMFSVLLRQARHIKKLEGEKTTANLNKKDQTRSGPSNKTGTGGGGTSASKSNSKEIDFDDVMEEMTS